jgi:hypothetical protein
MHVEVDDRRHELMEDATSASTKATVEVPLHRKEKPVIAVRERSSCVCRVGSVPHDPCATRCCFVTHVSERARNEKFAPHRCGRQDLPNKRSRVPSGRRRMIQAWSGTNSRTTSPKG